MVFGPGCLGGSGGPKNHSKRCGAKPPTFWNGFWGRRGRPDPRNRRFPAGPKTRFFGQVFLLEALGTRPNNHTFPRNKWFLGLAAEGGKANTPFVSWKMCGFLASVPQASKNHLAKQPLRDPFDRLVVVRRRHPLESQAPEPGRASEAACGRKATTSLTEAVAGFGPVWGRPSGAGFWPPIANGPKSGPKLPGPEARAIWDQSMLPSH
jgi:hypothetical protein